MVKLVLSQINEFDEIFEDMLMQFPKNELKTKEEFKKLLANKNYRLYKACEQDLTAGYVILYKDEQSSVVWLDYLAVFKPFHSQGFGKEILEQLKKDFKDSKGLYLEVEKPDKKVLNTIRRIKFYTSLGCTKLDIDYYYPCSTGCLAMDLYYLPFENGLPDKNDILKVIQSVFGVLHKSLTHLKDVINRIK